MTASTPGPFVSGPPRPSAVWYWVGGALIAAGVIGAVLWFITGFMRLDDAIDDFGRVPAEFGRIPSGAGGEVVIDEPGGQVVYAEGAVGDGVRFRLAVTGPSGEPVPVDSYRTSLTYDLGGRSGVAVATFEAVRPGRYRLVSEDVPFGVDELAVGPSIAGDLLRTILGAFVVAGLGVAVGGATLGITAVRRSKAKRARTPSWPSSHGPWAPPPASPWPSA